MSTDWYTPRSLFDFGWRASRRELLTIHALGYLFIFVSVVPFGTIDPAATDLKGSTLILSMIWSLLVLVVFVAMLAASVRRLHDQDKAGWFLLLSAIPLVGWIFGLIFVFTPGDEQENRYGPNPRFEPRLVRRAAGTERS